MNPEQFKAYRDFAARLQSVQREHWPGMVQEEFGHDPGLATAVLQMLEHLHFEDEATPTVRLGSAERGDEQSQARDLRFNPLGACVSRRTSLLAGAALAALFLLAVGGLLRQGFTTRYPVLFSWFEGPPHVTYVYKQIREDPAYDIEVGDTITRVNGHEVNDGQMARIRMRPEPPGFSAEFEFLRDGTTRTYRIPSFSQRFYMEPYLYLRWVFILVTWTIIAFAFFRNPRDPTVILTGLAGGIPIAAISIDFPTVGYGPALVFLLWEVAFAVTVGLEGVVFFHWTLRFPNRKTLTRSRLFAMYAAPVGLIIAAVIMLPILFLRNNLDLLYTVFRLQVTVDIIFVLLAFGMLIRSYLRALDPNRRLQVRWIMTGLIVGVTPEASFVFFEHVLRMPSPIPVILVDVGFLVVAAAFLFSVARYRLFDLELIMGYGGLLVVVAGVSLVLHQTASSFSLGLSGQSREAAKAASLVAGPALALVFRRPIHRYLGAVRFSPEGLSDECRDLLQGGTFDEAVVDRMLGLICRRLQVDRMALFLRDSTDSRYRYAGSSGFTSEEVRSRGLDETAAFPSLLANRRAPFRTETYAKSVLSLLPEQELEFLQQLNATVVAGILQRNRLVGFLTCSAHQTGALPDSKVTGFLGRLAGALADYRDAWSPPSDHLQLAGTMTAARAGGGPGQDSLPKLIGPYEIIRRIGAGGSGVVFEAHHQVERRNVAVKLLHREQAPRGNHFRNFLREIEALARINDPHVVQILDFGNCEGVPWFAMELVAGATLREHLLEVGTLSQAAAARIGAHVARGLEACHAAGVVHRDITPANIVYSGEKARIIDLGLARELHPGLQSQGSALIVGSIAGTASYMSPEQTMGRPLTGASDLFSLGIVLYECLAGSPPFRGETVANTIGNIKAVEYTPIEAFCPDVSAPMAQLIAELLEADPHERVNDAARVAGMLNRISRMELSAARMA